MRLNTKGRYAVMAMADIARYSRGAAISIAEISGRQKISVSYLEQLFAKLRKAALVSSLRGPGGGYRLAREAETISIAEIMQAVGEPLQMTRCRDDNVFGCIGGDFCLTHELWHGLGEHIMTYLEKVSLDDVLRSSRAGKDRKTVQTFFNADFLAAE